MGGTRESNSEEESASDIEYGDMTIITLDSSRDLPDFLSDSLMKDSLLNKSLQPREGNSSRIIFHHKPVATAWASWMEADEF